VTIGEFSGIRVVNTWCLIFGNGAVKMSERYLAAFLLLKRGRAYFESYLNGKSETFLRTVSNTFSYDRDKRGRG